jgi:FMN phosphatase YigB (HAD superfamily)
MKRRMKHVNHFMPITKNAENERMERRGRSGNEVFCVSRIVLLFGLLLDLVFDLKQLPQLVCLAFVPPKPTIPRYINPSFKEMKLGVAAIVDDTSYASNASEKFGKCHQLGLLTFDLDDTLFSINETVMDANARQLQYMREVLVSENCHLPFSISVQDFQRTMYDVRRDVAEPVSYTDLRKLTIRRIFMETGLSTNAGFDEVDRFVDKAFDVWLQERHLAAERYLFADALDTLAKLKNMYPDTCIAAITNGRGDPTRMVNSLAPFFDFCISGEDDNVFPERKPSPKIFELAIQRYQQLYPHHNSLSGRIWCHVGDCLVNDVGASAACGAFAIWYSPKESGYVDSGNVATSQVEPSKHPQQQGTKKIAVRVTNLAELPAAIKEFLHQNN